MIPAKISPANLFALMFLAGKPKEVVRQKQRLADGRSIRDQPDDSRPLRRSESRRFKIDFFIPFTKVCFYFSHYSFAALGIGAISRSEMPQSPS